jgi:acetylornithine deacetylase
MNSLEIAQQLIAFDSVSSKSNVQVSEFVASLLIELGFEVEFLPYTDAEGVPKMNIVARRLPSSHDLSDAKTGICYLAHTDVVPVDDWAGPNENPFRSIVKENRLWGRGACDMKGSLACALAAVKGISQQTQSAPIYFVVTADEEIGMEGAKIVDKSSVQFREMIHKDVVGVIGEPTSLEVIHAHKGGASLKILSRGRSAHSSTRDGINANYRMIPILPYLLELQQESESNKRFMNHDFDPPSLSMNIVINNEPFASNVTPSLAEVVVFIRTMPGVDCEYFTKRIESRALELGLDFTSRRCEPLSVSPSAPHVQEMLSICGTHQSKTVCYATDGSVLQRLKRLIVCGPGSIDQAHRNDEWISLEQLDRGTEVYGKAFERFAC